MLRPILWKTALLCLSSTLLSAGDMEFYRSLLPDSQYRLIAVETSTPHPLLDRTQLTLEAGNSDSLIRITRIRRSSCWGRDLKPVVLVGPIGEDGRIYEFHSDEYKNSLAGYLALDNFDVWTVSGRVTPLGPGTCETGSVDCSYMAGWDMWARIEDNQLARRLVRVFHRNRNPALVGLTGGGTVAIATINAHPGDYSGVYANGTLYSQDPDIMAMNGMACEGIELEMSQGIYWDNGLESFRPIVDAARYFPDEPAPELPGFPPGLTNHQLMVLLLSTPGGVPGPSPGYYYAAGDWVEDHFYHLDEDMFYQLVDAIPTFIARPVQKALMCGLAGDTTHVHNLWAFEGAVFLDGTEGSFGPMMADTAELFTAASSTIVFNREGWGEEDLMLHRDRVALIYQPLAQWLSEL